MREETMAIGDRRGHDRINLDIAGLPFMGYHVESLTTFAYDLFDISSTGVQIGVPRGEDILPMDQGDTVDLLLFFKSGDGGLFDRGRIKWVKGGGPSGATICGLSLGNTSQGRGEGGNILCRLSLSLESSNVMFEDSGADSAHDLFHEILWEAACIKEKILEEIEVALARQDNSMSGKEEHLRQLKAGYITDIDLLKSYGACGQSDHDSGMVKSPALTYEEVCALFRPGSVRLGPFLADLAGGGEAVSDRITSLNRRLLADHNVLVLLKMGYLASAYQGLETICHAIY